ncbi:hypothetical protein [Cryptosporangium minutisporangium]|uniref:DUF4190 domain-containing protein n=1 Tax=Cryptosporangium minutisporangium TaxID=113569 RepID=A0ABP6TAC1_9ACTN
MANVSGHPEMHYSGAPARSTRNGLAIGSLVVGIVALVASWVPIAGWLLGATAVVLGVLSRRQNKAGNSLGTAGLVIGAIAFVISTALFVLALVAQNS